MKKNGFTLLETIIVLGIISVFSLIGINTINSFREEAELDSAVNEFVTELKMARNKSMAGEVLGSETEADFEMDGLPQYGIQTTPGNYSLTRTFIKVDGSSGFDTLETIALDTGLTLSPLDTIYFDRISGKTSSESFNIQRSSGVGKKIDISSEGVITISDL